MIISRTFSLWWKNYICYISLYIYIYLQVTVFLRNISEQERPLPINFWVLVLLGNWVAESTVSTKKQEYFRIAGQAALFLPCFTAKADRRACWTAKHIAYNCLPAKKRENPVNGILRALGVRLRLLKYLSANMTASVSVGTCSQPAKKLELRVGKGRLGYQNRTQVVAPLVAKPSKGA